jgi:hypothetical protein
MTVSPDPIGEHISREEGLALFDAFASKEKSSHVNSGKHKEPPRVRLRFLRRSGRTNDVPGPVGSRRGQPAT